jgi:AraC-like DNA-binding protein
VKTKTRMKTLAPVLAAGARGANPSAIRPERLVRSSIDFYTSFQATGPPATDHRRGLYWETAEIGFVPPSSSQTLAWEQEAARLTFSLASVLVATTAHEIISRARGELVWAPRPEQPASFPLSVHPALLVHAASESLQADRVTIVPALPAHDPLLRHIALVLQAALEGEGGAGQLYAESLADALVVHFLRRYTAARPCLRAVSGRLSPYKLRRTTVYIKDHLEQALSLAQLAAVAQTSPAHFTRLFRHATGLAPHQYVLMCRMEQAKRLLAETDTPFGEIALQVGCADQSHFTALFRKHVALTPKAYRDTVKR